MSVDDMTITPAQLIALSEECLRRWPNAELIKSGHGTGNLCILDGGIGGEYVGVLDLRFAELIEFGALEEYRA